MATGTLDLTSLERQLQGALDTLPSAAPGGSLADPRSPRFQALARQHGLDPVRMGRLMGGESAYNPRATSPKGAQGLFQLMPSVQQEQGITDPYDPEQNVPAAMRHMAKLQQMYQGDWRLMLAAWNAGVGNVAKYGGGPP